MGYIVWLLSVVGCEIMIYKMGRRGFKSYLWVFFTSSLFTVIAVGVYAVKLHKYNEAKLNG